MTSEQSRRVEGAGECPSFEDLMAYSDNELDASRHSDLERHLASCRRCAAVLRSQARIEQTYRDSYSEPAPERFDELEAGLAKRFGHRRQRSAWVLPVAATLLVALAAIKLLGGGGGLLRQAVQEPAPPGGRYQTEAPPAAAEALPAETVLVTAEAVELEEALQPLESDIQRGQAGDALALGGEDENQAPDDLTSASGPADPVGAAAGDMTLETGTLSVIQTISTDAPAGGAGGLFAAQSQAGTGEGGGGGAIGGTCGTTAQTVAAPPDLGADYSGAVARDEAFSEDGSEQPALQEDSDQAAGRGYYMYRCFETPSEVVLEFDSLGTPSSPDSAYLDACFPGWKDSLDETPAGSILVVPVEELPDLMD